MAQTSITHFSCGQDLCAWANRLRCRFPKLIDSRLLKGIYAILGPGTSPSFLQKRSAQHLKRLVLTQFLLVKNMERIPSQHHPLPLVRIFSIDHTLCIAILYRKKENTLNKQTILKLASQKIPALKQIDGSFYQWENQQPSYHFSYVELKKVRGKNLYLAQIKELERCLKQELSRYLLESPMFWPYNYEEIFKQTLILAHEISSDKDAPQMSIHFQKQTSNQLEFLICLARPKASVCSETMLKSSHFPLATRLTPHMKQEVACTISTLIEAFSLLIPLDMCTKKEKIDLLYAREFILKLFEAVLGEVRDYNGGLFETKKNRFREMSNLCSETIPCFSLFSEKLFYSLKPIEAQICLSKTLFKSLAENVSHILDKPAPFSIQAKSHLAVFKLHKSDRIEFYIKKAENLLSIGEITSYTHFEILNEYYIGLIHEHKEDITTACKGFFLPSPTKQSRKLHLTFNFETPPSLDPYYLAKESRGRSLARLLYEPLFRLHPRKGLVHAACESMQLSKDGKRYLFKIRDFHWLNGEPVTALDYEKTWKKTFSKGVDLNLFYIIKNAEAIKAKRKNIDRLGVKAIDKNFLEVVLENKDPSFLHKLTYVLFFALPKGSLNSLAFNGPFFLTDENYKYLRLEKNPYYWDKEGVFFKEVEALFGHKPKGITPLFEQKKTDWLGTYCSLEESPSKLRFSKKVPFYFFIHLNTNCPALSSPFIRQALSCVINRNELINRFFPKSTPLSSFLFENPSPFLTPSHHSLLEGQALFNQGLKELRLTKKNFPTLNLLSSNSKRKDLSLYLKKQWESAFRIPIHLNCSQWDTFYQKIEQGDFHIGGFFKYAFPKDPIPFLDNFARKTDNLSHWEHPAYSKLLLLLKKEPCLKKRALLTQRANRFLQSQMPLIPLFSLTHHYTHQDGLKDYVFNDDGSLDFRFAFFDHPVQSARNLNQATPNDQNTALLNQNGMSNIETC